MRILILTKRQYTNKDLIDDRFGRLYELPLELARTGHQVTVICLSYRIKEEGHLLGPSKDGTTANWYSHNLGRFIIPGLIRYLKKVERLYSDFKPDLIFACSDAPHIIYGYKIARKLSIPCIIDLYDNFESFGLTKLPGILPLFKRAVKNAAGVVCVSSNLQNYIERSYRTKGMVQTISNGIPPELFHSIDRSICRKKLKLPANAKLIGTAGALGSSRGINTLFDGYKELVATDPSIHLVLAGSVEPGTTLPESDKIHYLGNLDYRDVPVLFNALDVGVICNIDSPFGHFCFPQKLYEMVACNLPVVAARVGASAEIMKEYPDFLFSPGDHQSLADAVKKQLKKPNRVQITVPTWETLATKLGLLIQNTKVYPIV